MDSGMEWIWIVFFVIVAAFIYKLLKKIKNK